MVVVPLKFFDYYGGFEMLEDIFIIDNFYDDPDYIRQMALDASYLKFPDDANFPGYESAQSFYAEDHRRKFKRLINRNLYIDQEEFVYGKFRFSPGNSKSQSDMHIDTPTWAAMIYLTLDKDCRGGLGIYQHKETGILHVPQTSEEFRSLGFENFEDMDRRLVYPDTKNNFAWKLIEFIPMKYNRLVLFKGSRYFHSITEKFGNEVNDSRLTHSFFFNEAPNI